MIIPVVIVLVIFVIAVVMMFLLTGIIRLCSGECYSGNITVSHFAEVTEQQTQELLRAIEEHLPDVRITGEEEITCPVCLDEIGREDIAKLLPCKHYYHSECLMAWCTKGLQKICAFLKVAAPSIFPGQWLNFRAPKTRLAVSRTMTRFAATAASILFAALGAAANGWIEMTPGGTIPAERSDHAAVWAPAADGFYLFSGEARGWMMDDLHFYDRQANQWSEVTPGGTAPGYRDGHTMVWAPGSDGFYVFGGWGDDGYTNKLHFYDRQANQWIEVTPAGTAPAGRKEHAAVWAPTADGFYVFGGSARDGMMEDLHFYDRQANQWSEVTPGGTAPG
eukprot:s1200_g28.t1